VKDECIYTSSPHICLCCAQGQIYIFFCNLILTSLFIKCPAVSCVQIMECSNVLVTQQKKTDLFTDVLSQDMNRLLLSIDAQHNSLPCRK